MRRLLVAASVAAVLVSAAAGSAAVRRSSSPQPTLGQLVGQHLLARMQGSWPTRSFLGRITRGEIGGVVIFQNNIPAAGVAKLIQRLQAAARAGGQLPLLIAVDQEGGGIKRLPGPPTVAPAAMTGTTVAYQQGLATGTYLRRLGIGMDLAPVLDVPSSTTAFIAGRAFGSDPRTVSARGAAFAQGLVRGHVAAAAKHFPGLGRLAQSTDYAPAVVHVSRAALESDLSPFTTAVKDGVPAVMVGTAIYPAYGSKLPAACSRTIVTGLLRSKLGFRGVAISDDLDTAGVWSELPPPLAAVRALQAGIDMVYVAGVNGGGGDAIGEETYTAMLRAARQGLLPNATLRTSYARIAQLKQAYAQP